MKELCLRLMLSTADGEGLRAGAGRVTLTRCPRCAGLPLPHAHAHAQVDGTAVTCSVDYVAQRVIVRAMMPTVLAAEEVSRACAHTY